MVGYDGGRVDRYFNGLLGNPPWERIKLQEEEFFATRHAAVAQARNKAERHQRIQWLREGTLSQHLTPGDAAHHTSAESDAEQRLYDEFIATRRTAEAASVFMHLDGAEGGRYPLTGVGDVNTYALFAETVLQINASSGRAGFIVPTGIATDDSTKSYFGHIAQSGRLVSLLGFWEIRRIFPGTDSRDSFALLTLGKEPIAEFLFHAKTVDALQDVRRRFTLTVDEFRLVNPNTLTCPVFRSERDAALTKKLYRTAPVLLRDAVTKAAGKKSSVIARAANPWGISFQTMFHMSGDSELFKDTPAPDRLPLYEAKLIHQFDHRWATYGNDGDSRDLTPGEKQNPATKVTPRYWVAQREVWLRVARLPDGLLKALKEWHEELITLGMTQLLFARWLASHPDADVYPAWQAFVQQNPYASGFAPTQLGLCGNNSPCLQPLDGNYLPAEQEVQAFMSNARTSTAWYAVNPDALQSTLNLGSEYQHLPAPGEPMKDAAEVLALAESWLEAACPKWLMGWRDICRSTDERTVIASAMPLSAVNHKTPLWFAKAAPSARHVAALLGNFDALALDYVARQKVGGTSLTYFYLKQLPFLPPHRYGDADLAFLVPRVLELTYTAHEMAGWAKDLGHDGPPFHFDPERRAVIRAELDAHYARLYDLDRDELRYILDPADVMGPDYPSETFRVLKNKERIPGTGHYRTQQLVLREFDRMALAQASGELFHSLLTPPPGQLAQPSYSAQGVVKDETDARLLGVLLSLVRQQQRLPRRQVVDALNLAERPDLLATYADAKSVSIVTAFKQRHPDIFAPSRLAGDRIHSWLRHLESIGVLRLDAQADTLLALPPAATPGHVLVDDETLRVAAVLHQAAAQTVVDAVTSDTPATNAAVKRA